MSFHDSYVGFNSNFEKLPTNSKVPVKSTETVPLEFDLTEAFETFSNFLNFQTHKPHDIVLFI